MDEQNDNLSDLADPAQQAAAVVAEHVTAVIDSAERQAHEVLRDAERDAEATRLEALESAQRVFERIDQLERPLREFVQNLRLETDRVERELAGHVDAEATPISSQSDSANAALSQGGAEAVEEEPVEAPAEPETPLNGGVEDPVEKPVNRGPEEAVDGGAGGPVPEPGAEPVAEPVAERAGKLEDKPLDEPVTRPAAEPAAKKFAGKDSVGKTVGADKRRGKRSAAKKPSGKKSGRSKPSAPSREPEAEHSTDADRVAGNGDEGAAQQPAAAAAAASPAPPGKGAGFRGAEEPRPATASPPVESGPGKLASRLLGRLRDSGATKTAFITTEGHCSVCQNTLMAGSEEELAQSGWKVNGDVGLCPECQSDAWQLPEGARLPFRRGGG